jgi:peroxiredoxin
MTTSLRIGQRLPPTQLGEIVRGEVNSVTFDTLLSGRRAVVFGIAGAYTPICSQRHAPEFVAQADKLKQAGYDMIICVGANDPWTMAAWGAELDPYGKLRFLSDGNLDFARATGLIERHADYFLGDRLKRFVLTAENAVVQHLGVENTVLTLSCSRAADVLLAA